MNYIQRVMRAELITWACDADYQRLSQGSSVAGRLTIAEALEVLDD